MSKSKVNYEFSEFGSKMKKIGILSIFAFISSFVVNIGNLISNILLPVRIITLVFQIIILIFMFSALENSEEVNTIFNNRDLEEFRNKIYYGFILSIIGWVLFIIGIALISFYVLVLGFTFFIIGSIIVIISGIFRVLGWYGLEKFFKTNLKKFPSDIGEDALSGAKFLKYGAFCHLLVFTSFIGLILDVIGSFKLSSLKDLLGKKS